MFITIFICCVFIHGLSLKRKMGNCLKIRVSDLNVLLFTEMWNLTLKSRLYCTVCFLSLVHFTCLVLSKYKRKAIKACQNLEAWRMLHVQKCALSFPYITWIGYRNSELRIYLLVCRHFWQHVKNRMLMVTLMLSVNMIVFLALINGILRCSWE